MLGQLIDRKYRVLSLIGEGGMSAIYEAEHVGLDRHVAIKVLHPSLADDPEAIARLRHEAKVVSAIGHPNICEVYDLGRTDDSSPYLVMELLVGESLAERLKNSGPMHFLELAPLMRQILAALDAAHKKGILHRDLKPENVFVEVSRHGGRLAAKLLDFGISKSMSYEFQEQQRLTHTGMVMGTPYYMAPEQARGDSGLDQRVDLWAVGVIMYEALTGRRPFVATNYNALLVKILTSRPRPAQKLVASIPDLVAGIVDKALSKLREDRFQTAMEFSDAIAYAERVCFAEDPQAPTRMFRRGPATTGIPGAPVVASAAVPPPAGPPRAVPSRPWEIDDPPTFIDDDVAYDPSQIAGPLKEYRPPAPALREEIDGEVIEPTIRDRPRRSYEEAVPYEAAQNPATESHDTEVMRVGADGRVARERRGVRERRSVGDGGGWQVQREDRPAESTRDTEVMRRRLFSDAEKTEVVVQRQEAEEPTPVALPRNLIPPPPPARAPVAQSRPAPQGEAAANRQQQSRQAAQVRQAPQGRQPPPGRQPAPGRQPPQVRPTVQERIAQRPRVPRPNFAADDEEKTTLFDPEKARAMRKQAEAPDPKEPVPPRRSR
jgi:serine/threonine protein kinase